MSESGDATKKRVRSGRRRLLFALLLFAIAALAGGGYLLSRERILTDHAAKVTNVGKCLWLTDDELLWFMDKPGRITRLNLRTHAQAIIKEMDWARFHHARLSPDGKRFVVEVWRTDAGGGMEERQPSVLLCDVDGGHSTLLPDPKDESATAGDNDPAGSFGQAWMPDGKRWLRFLRQSEEIDARGSHDGSHGWLYSVDSPDRQVKVAKMPLDTPVLADVMPNGDMLMTNVRGAGETDLALLHTVPFVSGSISEQLHKIPAPHGWRYQALAISRRKDRVAWLLTTTRRSAILAFMAKFAPSLAKAAAPQRWYLLRTSRLDGTDMRDIGVQNGGSDGAGEVSNLAWRPNGAEVSFFFRGDLYIVPVR